MYACHRFHWKINEEDSENSAWKNYANKYINSSLITSESEMLGDVDVYEIATGSSENTKTKNIYDLAGNMWELTTEKSPGGQLICRGGCFTNNGKTFNIAYKSLGLPMDQVEGDNDAVTFGFRVVLYLN